MKVQAVALYLIFLFSPFMVFADGITQGLSYTVDGPANIRDTPKGEVIDSLPDGYIVNVINSGGNGWCKIVYVLQNKTKSGWTHEGNLKFVVMSFEDLIRNNKVTYASQYLNYYGENEIILFGKSIRFNEIGDGTYRATPIKPIDVKVYCIDGSVQENKILYVDLVYGGDASSWSGNLVTLNNVKNTDCIYVNGHIRTEINHNKNNKLIHKCDFCEKSNDSLPGCRFVVGDMNNDGTFEAIVQKTNEGAPYFSVWNIYQLGEDCKYTDIGTIGEFSSP